MFYRHTLLSLYLVLKLYNVFVSSQSFLYEKMHNFGRGNKIIENYRRVSNDFKNRFEYPAPLPSPKPGPHDYMRSPYHSIYQGRRLLNDKRVFRRRFEYRAKLSGHQIFCEGMFDCAITHMAVETSGGIPILLRGGVGYHYFMVVARAKPGDDLKGSVRAYCAKQKDDYYSEKKNL